MSEYLNDWFIQIPTNWKRTEQISVSEPEDSVIQMLIRWLKEDQIWVMTNSFNDLNSDALRSES